MPPRYTADAISVSMWNVMMPAAAVLFNRKLLRASGD